MTQKIQKNIFFQNNQEKMIEIEIVTSGRWLFNFHFISASEDGCVQSILDINSP